MHPVQPQVAEDRTVYGPALSFWAREPQFFSPSQCYHWELQPRPRKVEDTYLWVRERRWSILASETQSMISPIPTKQRPRAFSRTWARPLAAGRWSSRRPAPPERYGDANRKNVKQIIWLFLKKIPNQFWKILNKQWRENLGKLWINLGTTWIW